MGWGRDQGKRSQEGWTSRLDQGQGRWGDQGPEGATLELNSSTVHTSPALPTLLNPQPVNTHPLHLTHPWRVARVVVLTCHPLKPPLVNT